MGRKLAARDVDGRDAAQSVKLGPEDDVEKQAGYTRHGFNQLRSDRIALDRFVPDARDPL